MALMKLGVKVVFISVFSISATEYWLIWISHRQHRCCIPKIGVIGVRNKLRQQPMYSWPGTDASTGFIGCAYIL